MTGVRYVTLEVPDVAAAEAFYASLGMVDRLRLRQSDSPTDGFRGFTLSILVSQPSTADAVIGTAVAAGATSLKAPSKSFWGYGGVVRAPDGAIWKVASSSKKDSEPANRRIDDVVLLLGVADVKASKQFYVEHGLTVDKSFGSKYVQFQAGESEMKLALYGRSALAKDAGVPVEGSGSHRLAIATVGEPFSDPDGFTWEPASVTTA